MAKKIKISLKNDIRFWRLLVRDTTEIIGRVEYLCSNGSWLKLRYDNKRRQEVELYPNISGVKKFIDAEKEVPRSMKIRKGKTRNKTTERGTKDLNNVSRPHKCFQRDALDRFGNIIGVEYRCTDGTYIRFALPPAEKKGKD